MSDRRARPHGDDLRSWPRKREYAWMVIAALLLAHWTVLGSLDLEARSVTDRFVEEEGARRASASANIPLADAGDPRELPQRKLSHPLRCDPPKAEWILQWGDGALPGATRATSVRCVKADLRRHRYVQ